MNTKGATTKCPECGDGLVMMWTGKSNLYRCLDSVHKITGCKWEGDSYEKARR